MSKTLEMIAAANPEAVEIAQSEAFRQEVTTQRRLLAKLFDKETDPLISMHYFYKLLDEMIHKAVVSKNQHSCTKGCYYCCYQPIRITEAETDFILKYMEAEKVEVDMKLLKKQSKFTLDTWVELKHSRKRCAFLGDDNLCKVYRVRPIVCRNYFVNTDPKNCNFKHVTHQTDLIMNYAIVAVIMAFYDIVGEGRFCMPNILHGKLK